MFIIKEVEQKSALLCFQQTFENKVTHSNSFASRNIYRATLIEKKKHAFLKCHLHCLFNIPDHQGNFLLRGRIHMVDFMPFYLTVKTTFVASCLAILSIKCLLQMGFILTGKNLLPSRANTFLLEESPSQN